MSNYRQDFEGGATLAVAAPELVDFDSQFSIDSTGAHALTGTHSLKLPGVTSSHNIYNNANDSLNGDVTFTAYMQASDTAASLSIYTRIRPAGTLSANTYLRMLFGSTGIQIVQNNGGSVTTLNTTITFPAMLTGVWLCLELRCVGTAVTARVIRQDNGQFFVNSGSGSWSSSPQVQSGTAVVTGAGGIGFRGGDNAGLYQDDWMVEPGTPAIDVTSFSLTGAGATQQLTAQGFTDPLFGVTWSSSNTAVATVNSTGLVTAVGAGSATITATGKRDTAQTATSVATVSLSAATTYSFTAPSPASGYSGSQSGLFTVTPNGVFTGSITINFSSGFGLSTLGHTWSASSTPWTFAITPTAPGLVVLTPTNSSTLGDPPALSYASLAQGLAILPANFTVSLATTASMTGTGTRWLTTPPSLTISGAAAAGTTLGSVAVSSDTTASVLVTPGTTTGSLVFRETNSGATSAASVGAAASTWGYLSSVVGFSAGLTGSVGYAVLRSDGSGYKARTTLGVFAIGGGYAALVALPISGAYVIVWDDGSGHFAFEVVNPTGVEPPSTAVPGGLNQSQCLADLHAVLADIVSGFSGTGSSNPVFMAPDGVTPRVSGTVDQLGNRTSITLNPPL